MRILLSILLAIACSANAATKAAPQPKPAPFDPVLSFQSLVSTSSEPKEWTKVIFVARVNKWAKMYFTLGDVKYDVKKTDSLINPMVGMVNFPIGIRHSEPFDTEEDAANSTTTKSQLSIYQVEGTYHVDGQRWVLKEFRYSSTEPGNPLRGKEYTFDPAKLERDKNSALGSALLRWMQ